MREMLKRKSFQEAKKKYDDSLKNSCITTLLYKRFEDKNIYLTLKKTDSLKDKLNL
jgi:hypothetical protein